MKKFIFIVSIFIIGFGLSAQILPFTRDHSFQLQLDLMDNFDFTKDTVIYLEDGDWIRQKGGLISDIWEDPETGKIYLMGDFEYHHNNGNFYYGHLSFTKDGSFHENFYIENLTYVPTIFFPINDSTFYLTDNSGFTLIDSLGNYMKYTVYLKNYRKSVPCRSTAFPFFFEDGSSLWSNSQGNFNGCDIVLPPDTFPHRYLVKVDPEGKWDSTFTIDVNRSGINFQAYDSSRILMFAHTRFIYQYDGHTVNGVWRTFLDGTLDTTFNAPISDAWVSGGFSRPPLVQQDGKILLRGYFQLEGSNQYHTLIRLNPDGSLDSTFMNYAGPKDTANPGLASVTLITPTPDGGFIVAGFFNSYQGYNKNAIAKIDKNGVVEPQYFTGSGPGDAFNNTYPVPSISGIVPSVFGGYYITGNFRSWNGQPSQPIIRLHGMYVGLEEHGQEIQKLKIFPNPASERINFYVKANDEPEEVVLIDIQGKSIEADFQETSFNTYEINISNLKPGMYFLKMLSEGEVSVGKFVKE